MIAYVRPELTDPPPATWLYWVAAIGAIYVIVRLAREAWVKYMDDCARVIDSDCQMPGCIADATTTAVDSDTRLCDECANADLEAFVYMDEDGRP